MKIIIEAIFLFILVTCITFGWALVFSTANAANKPIAYQCADFIQIVDEVFTLKDQSYPYPIVEMAVFRKDYNPESMRALAGSVVDRIYKAGLTRDEAVLTALYDCASYYNYKLKNEHVEAIKKKYDFYRCGWGDCRTLNKCKLVYINKETELWRCPTKKRWYKGK